VVCLGQKVYEIDQMKRATNFPVRIFLGIGCTAALIIIFLFQRLDVAAWLGIDSGNITRFIVNRSIRFLLNDLLTIGLIFSIFYERKYVMFAIVVQVFGLIVFLIPYFVLKVHYPSYNGPLLSFLHRLILNPTLLLLLIPAFYFQRKKAGQIENGGSWSS